MTPPATAATQPGHAIDLIKIRTLAEAGVPLARIRELRGMSDEQFRGAVDQVDRELAARIQALRETRQRLRHLDSGHLETLPVPVADHLRRLPEFGFTPRWVAMETGLWILVFATHPDTASELLRNQADALTDPALHAIYLAYNQAHDLHPSDPELDELARRIVTATRLRYATTRVAELPGQAADRHLSTLVQEAVNASSPAWRELDILVRRQLSN